MDNFKKISRQLVFYVTFGALIPLYGYSSDMITMPEESEKIKTYYPQHLMNLKEAVKPRPVTYIDSDNTRRYGSLAVTGILFTYKNAKADNVFFVSDADHFKRIPMRRNRYGVWFYIHRPTTFIEKRPRTRLRYRFFVDGMYITDDTNDSIIHDAAGQQLSVFYLLRDMFKPETGAVVLRKNIPYGREVLFRLKAGSASEVSLVGTFNNWNPDIDVMKKKNGYFYIKKVLPPGEHLFMYRVDGSYRKVRDHYNRRLHPVYGETAYLKIEK